MGSLSAVGRSSKFVVDIQQNVDRHHRRRRRQPDPCHYHGHHHRHHDLLKHVLNTL